MKRIAFTLLALLLLLSACGAGEAAQETTAETTSSVIETTTSAIETTAEAPTVPTNGEGTGVKWRTLDLEDKANAGVKEWLEESFAAERPQEYAMGAHKKIVYRYESSSQLVLVEDGGKETVLLRSEYLGDETDPEKRKNDEVRWRYPGFGQALNDRYFLVRWQGWEWCSGISMYDTEELREIPVEMFQGIALDSAGIRGGALYLRDHIYGGGSGQMHIYAIALDGLDTAKSLAPGKNLLEGIPEADIGETYHSYDRQIVSPDAKYLAVAETEFLPESETEITAVRLFDLTARSFACRLTSDSTDVWIRDLAFRDEHTLYAYQTDWDGEKAVIRGHALEITLP